MKIAILGWGSLLWDVCPDFDDFREPWEYDGPILPIEFSRVSKGRGGALTLVIDEKNGDDCKVAFAISKRKAYEDAIADLRCREGTILKYIAFQCLDGSTNHNYSPAISKVISDWVVLKAIDVLVWTALPSNFPEKNLHSRDAPFSVANAIHHLHCLPPDAKAMAAQYVWRAPDFIHTHLRRALQAEPWFSSADNS